MELLLLSNSTNKGDDYLGHAKALVEDFLAGIPELLFIPFALADHDGYTRTVQEALPFTSVRGIHDAPDPAAALAEAEAVFVGGGNTFRLTKTLQETALLAALRLAVRSGTTRYIGASAGTNIAAPTLRTTNDMPIVEPPSFETLGLVPFQINPHFLDADPSSTHAGESRETRLSEYLEENDIPVLGLREGTHLRVQADVAQDDRIVNVQAAVAGKAVSNASGPAVVFTRAAAPREVAGDVSWLFGQFDREPLGS
ncbi:dipeptidase PepE [Saxibacter everestensis]|uniref:Dipeptidase PepE n=1 Tax=Saxibacter everestensis TaxID=2909229 RepID=A0ABY8QV08_9MICO|nr:dipeptidase PepE [Brevibacteriaceae bacterium ZFBP1038]